MNNFTFRANNLNDVAAFSAAISMLCTQQEGIDKTRLTIVVIYGSQSGVCCQLQTEMNQERILELMAIAELGKSMTETLEPLENGMSWDAGTDDERKRE